ncbi:MAG: response regulator [Candidatus Parcubacteria bacterium]|nr:response regulator [Candidatus Parcubacteria bacterium]
MSKILAVDNDLNTLETICLSLEAGGHKASKAESGEQALKVLKQNKIDLILLDIMMPKVDGIQVAKNLAADSAFKKIPIILISALPIESNSFKKALKETEKLDNVKGSIEKPFKLEDLLAKIDVVLKGV